MKNRSAKNAPASNKKTNQNQHPSAEKTDQLDRIIAAGIRSAKLRLKYTTSAEMDDLMDSFVQNFSQAYFDAFNEQIEPVDIEEYMLMLHKKFMDANGYDPVSIY
jgi:hypothetical protein